MDEEIEEVIENVKQTDSQKSVATSNMYSFDFTDSGSDKHNSSGMETYILEWDSEASESPHSKSIAISKDIAHKSMNVNRDVQREVSKKNCKETTANAKSFSKHSIVSQEIFTQTSKTIIQLAESEGVVMKTIDCNTLETQTSLISIKENRMVEYRLHVTDGNKSFTKSDVVSDNSSNHRNVNQLFNNSLEDGSSKLMQISETEYENTDETISPSSSEKAVKSTTEGSKETIPCEEANEYDTNSDFEDSGETTDVEEDSLEPIHRAEVHNNTDDECDTPKSVDQDVAELYSKLCESMDFQSRRPFEQEKKHFGDLTTLTEESVVRKSSSADMVSVNACSSSEEDKDVLFTNKAGIKVKLFPEENSPEAEAFKLPPIQGNHVNPCVPNLDFLFSVCPNKLQLKPAILPCVFEDRREERHVDRWEMGAKELAAGESPLISGRSDYDRGHSNIQLPPIHQEGFTTGNVNKADGEHNTTDYHASDMQSPINIKDKIKELKPSHKIKNWNRSKYNIHSSDSRSGSPSSVGDDNKAVDTAERGCELLCMELLKRLRSATWYEVTDTLDDMPRVLEKFWNVMSEQRIADLLRQVTAHVESPRSRVARAACHTLSCILMNTNYTKKPDFYEAVTILLIKTGSFSRPVRRAANVALDNIVCGVDLCHVVTVLCTHGATHKSALVRCASARLLVVCCALGGGGRELLRARPSSAASARRHALRSLATLLEDKSTDTRKYAERLYSMLRPLANFEAYYLTDVDVELASRQMKKYDQLLLGSVCGPPEPR